MRNVPIPQKLNEVGPVARVWVIVQTMPRASRAEVLQACKKLGINQRTAATQWQLAGYAKRQATIARHLPARVRRQIERAAKIAS